MAKMKVRRMYILGSNGEEIRRKFESLTTISNGIWVPEWYRNYVRDAAKNEQRIYIEFSCTDKTFKKIKYCLDTDLEKTWVY